MPDSGPNPTGTLAVGTAARLERVEGQILDVLEVIHAEAPNAEILLVGYPPLFIDGGACLAPLSDASAVWLNSVGSALETQQIDAVLQAQNAGIPAHFVPVGGAFDGSGVCGDTPGITGIMPYVGTPSTGYGTTGELARLVNQPGLPVVGISQQSLHPNNTGSTLMGDVAEQTLDTFY